MAWIDENYDKAAIGAGVILLVALGFFGWSKMSGAEDRLQPYSAINPRVQEIPGAAITDKVIQSIDEGHDIVLEPVGSQTYHLFVGPSLWLRKGNQQPAPLYDGDPLHPPIPNRWWMDRNMDDTMRKADAPGADDDGDGFTNREEFDAETDPTDPAKHPPLIEKLRVVEVKESKMYLKLAIPEKDKTGIQALKGRGTDWEFRNLTPGDKFGPPENEERFELLDVERRPYKQGGLDLEDWRADFKDLGKPDQPTYQLFRRNRFLAIVDKTVVFTLLAGPDKGQNFEVEEGGEFSLPPGGEPTYQLLKADAGVPSATLLGLADKKEIKIN